MYDHTCSFSGKVHLHCTPQVTKQKVGFNSGREGTLLALVSPGGTHRCPEDLIQWKP